MAERGVQRLGLADGSFGDQAVHFTNRGKKSRPDRLHAKYLAAPRCVDDLSRLRTIQRKRLLADHRLSGLDGE